MQLICAGRRHQGRLYARGVRDEGLPLDEARLLARFRRHELEREQARMLLRLVEENPDE